MISECDTQVSGNQVINHLIAYQTSLPQHPRTSMFNVDESRQPSLAEGFAQCYERNSQSSRGTADMRLEASNVKVKFR